MVETRCAVVGGAAGARGLHKALTVALRYFVR